MALVLHFITLVLRYNSFFLFPFNIIRWCWYLEEIAWVCLQVMLVIKIIWYNNNALHSPELDDLAWPSFLIWDEHLVEKLRSVSYSDILEDWSGSPALRCRRDINFKPNAVVVCKVNRSWIENILDFFDLALQADIKWRDRSRSWVKYSQQFVQIRLSPAMRRPQYQL